ncbi:MAG: GNAT family N-acetyltransferase [Rhodocyclaceae bacterium]|nr:MAG: GNAT family N-acetyltransferase [Rhodocyclaceae bacterium]
MLQLNQPVSKPARHQLHVGLAHSSSEILDAQRLRYRVFADELGARLPSKVPGVDQDYYDRFCEHLIVRDDVNQKIIGTYRILSPEAARRAGSYYSETEFNLDRLNHLRDRTVEVGRSCIHPDYRTGGTIALLWSGLVRYMLHNHHEYLIGCASIGMADGGHAAAGIYHRMEAHMAPPEYRVFPNCPLPLDRIEASKDAECPPLIKGYLRAGAYVCGDPAWDPDFNTADMLMMLPMSRIDARYARHFVERQAA